MTKPCQPLSRNSCKSPVRNYPMSAITRFSPTYAHSPSPEPPPPPLFREKDIQGYTPHLGYWLPLAITKKNTPFSWFSREIFQRLRQKKIPPFPRKWERACPLMHSSGGGGGGGACDALLCYLSLI